MSDYQFGRASGARMRLLAAVICLGGVSAGLTKADTERDQRRGTSPSRSCALCHRVEPLFSHPIDVAPSMQTPARLPLEGGRLACLTCHDPGPPGAAHGDGSGPLLRGGATARELCAACHLHGDAADAHRIGLGRAHLRWPDRPADAGRAPGEPDLASLPDLDGQSAECMGCHDGAFAMGDHYLDRSGGGPRVFLGLNGGHPVGIDYPRDPARLRSPSELDGRLRLVDGRVGCGTCHSPFSPHRDLLVMANDRSVLCLSCHKDR